MIDESLAALSDTLFSVSVGLYSLAVVAFCAELAFGRSRQPRELVAAGGPALPPAGASAVTPAAEPEGARRLGLVAMVLTGLGAVTHAGVLVARGMATDRLPWGNMYEFATAVVLVAVVAYLVLAVRAPALRHIGVFLLAPVVLSMVLIGLFLYAEAGPLVAALRSSWLAIHVSTATIGFGIFFVSGIASILYLVRTRRDALVAAGASTGAPAAPSLLDRLPTAAALDRTAHRTAVFGFPIWTFAVIAGAIWAESAWGRFWGWDPKETWAFIAWIVYAAYLHARTTAGWRGRPSAWINIVGLAVMIFNLLFVNLVSTGLHSYGGV
ncbi:c-type cytochrome biogenesis protein CcsB [Modestobacter marinus]|uniref:C-type cytochrome biogenesis protein CcsB n=1 Tax=Modestobacter marinus TaxID=477641 RepID=A0A846LIU4_9ACTN|nr:c-type cytochrome biogenesis protein CcsB [Modestobacter marinus]NIH67467.1 cytochrome c-type biogenesis protein CcsB [Modestobacter marinus]GGL55121.1 c-type cytochrome biogenesis protein CcsB [Modestobacter marinus]